jgi:nitrate reductase delta subunit
MNKDYKVLSILLDYPIEHSPDEVQIMKETLPQVESFFEWMLKTPLLEQEEKYVEQVDRSSRGCLYLFEHIHGESRDRGGAMVSLKEHYLQYGFEATESDLPDYLPLMLEFMSCIPLEEAQKFLAQFSTPLSAVIEHHHQKSTLWSPLLQLLKPGEK